MIHRAIVIAGIGSGVSANSSAQPASIPQAFGPRPMICAPDSPDADVAVARFDSPAALLAYDGCDRPNPRGRQIAGSSFLNAGFLPEGDTPIDLAFTPDGARLVVAHRDSRNLIVYDAATRAFLDEIAISGTPQAVAISSDGQHAVVANIWEDSASIVNLGSGIETAVIPVGDQPGIVRITPNGAWAVVGNTRAGSLSVIDIATASELRRINGVGFISSTSINFESGVIVPTFGDLRLADNTKAVCSDFYNNRIHIIDLTTGALTTLPCDPQPRGVAVTPDGTKAVVAHFFTNHVVTVVDVTAGAISTTHAVAFDPAGPIAINPAGTKALVASFNTCRMLNLTTGVSGPDLTAGTQALATTADGSYVVCAGASGSLVSFTTDNVVKSFGLPTMTSLVAVSPSATRAALCGYLFSEDLAFVSTVGAPSIVEGLQPSGPAPEADKPRDLALNPAGTLAVTTNIHSDTASIIDMAARTVDAVVAVGDRPSEVAITPDGSKAVVANLDSTFASIINLSTNAVTSVPISRRAAQVEISPDGLFAYLSVVADGDGVWRIDLNTMTVAGAKLPTGDMGSAGLLYQQSSGMTLSHNGAVLATCNTFTDNITLINTATWSVITTVTVGDAPVRAVFSADDSLIFVSCRDDDTLRVVSNAGGASAVVHTVPVGDGPSEIALAADGSRAYVANFNAKTVSVVNLTTWTATATIPLPEYPSGLQMDAAGGCLHASSGTWSVTLGPGPAVSIAESGQYSLIDLATNTIAEQANTGRSSARLVLHEGTPVALLTTPLAESVNFIDFVVPCPGDLTNDGEVALGDLALLLAHFGTTSGATPGDGDLDGDGDVDLSDLAALLSAFGTVC